MFAIEDYLHGRCHLFAYVLGEITQSTIELAWDKEHINQIDGQKIPALIHAYIVEGNSIVDAAGRRTKKRMLENFEFTSVSYEKSSTKRIQKMIELGILCDFEENEYEELELYILKNEKKYL